MHLVIEFIREPERDAQLVLARNPMLYSVVI